MKRKNTATQMIFIQTNQLTSTQINKLKKDTNTFLKKIKYSPDDFRISIYEIPWHLIVVPDYQTDRAVKAESDGHIDQLIAEWNKNESSPCRLNLRTDGPYAGLLFIYDGYHRARAQERMANDHNWTGIYAQIANVNYNEEARLFFTKEIKKEKSDIHVYNAKLLSSDMEDIDVKAAHYVDNIIKKYKLDTAISGHAGANHIKLSLNRAQNIGKEDILKGKSALDWSLHILAESNVAQTHNGLSAKMLNALAGIYDRIESNQFNKVTINDAMPVLIDNMKHHTWGTIQDLGITIMNEPAIHTKIKSPETRARYVFGYWICQRFNIDFYGIVKNL